MSSLSTIPISGQVSLFLWGLPLHCRTRGSIPRPLVTRPAAVSPTPPHLCCDPKNVSRYCQLSIGGQNHPPLRTAALEHLPFTTKEGGWNNCYSHFTYEEAEDQSSCDLKERGTSPTYSHSACGARAELLGPSPIFMCRAPKKGRRGRDRASKMDAFRKGGSCFQSHFLPIYCGSRPSCSAWGAREGGGDPHGVLYWE